LAELAVAAADVVGEQAEEGGGGKGRGTVVSIKKVIMCSERLFHTSVYPACIGVIVLVSSIKHNYIRDSGI
jgi:hypothetical protein